MLTTQQVIEKFGEPNETGEGYLTQIQIPYPMRLAWDKNKVVNKISCHKLVAVAFTSIFNELLATYRLEKLKELGIDIYGGCFNYRKMRGGNEWSRHSWGIAIDLDPENNALKSTALTATFAKEVYKPMLEIFYKHGFVSLGKEKNYDWMHFEYNGTAL